MSILSANGTATVACPRCGAIYKLVLVEAPAALSTEVTCLHCNGPLPDREGDFILKYFLVDPPRPRQDPVSRPRQRQRRKR